MTSTNLRTIDDHPSTLDSVSGENDHGELQELLKDDYVPEDNGDIEEAERVPSPQTAVSSAITRRLYISHFLSTWNSRLFEFGAVLFIAEIYPGTLLPVSIYAVVRSASAIVFSPRVGRYIDVHNRLKVVRTSIGRSTPKLQWVCPSNLSTCSQ